MPLAEELYTTLIQQILQGDRGGWGIARDAVLAQGVVVRDSRLTTGGRSSLEERFGSDEVDLGEADHLVVIYRYGCSRALQTWILQRVVGLVRPIASLTLRDSRCEANIIGAVGT